MLEEKTIRDGSHCSMAVKPSICVCFCFILLTHEGSHREVYRDYQPSYDIIRRSGAKGYLDTGSVQLQLTLHNCQLCIKTEPTGRVYLEHVNSNLADLKG